MMNCLSQSKKKINTEKVYPYGNSQLVSKCDLNAVEKLKLL